MNKLSKNIKAHLDNEMFELINNDITSENEIAEHLSEILYEDYGFSDSDAILAASVYAEDHYADITSDVEQAREEATEEYYDRRHSYFSSVMGVY